MKEIPSKDKKSYDRVYNSSHSFCFSFSKPAQMLCKVVRVIAEEVVKSLSLASPLPPPPSPPPKRKKKEEEERQKKSALVLWSRAVDGPYQATCYIALHRSCKAIHPEECPRITSIVRKVQLSLRWYLSAQKRLCVPHSLSEVSRV